MKFLYCYLIIVHALSIAQQIIIANNHSDKTRAMIMNLIFATKVGMVALVGGLM